MTCFFYYILKAASNSAVIDDKKHVLVMHVVWFHLKKMSKEKKVGFCPERLQPTHELPSLCICVQSYLPITSLSRDRQVSEHVCHPLLNCKELASVGSLD